MIQTMTDSMEAGGEPITEAGMTGGYSVWAPDGKRLLFIHRSGIFQHEIGGSTHEIYTGDSPLEGLSIARRPSSGSPIRLISTRTHANLDIFAMPLRTGGLTPDGPAIPVIRSTANDLHPRFSPDGKRLAFVSDRTGHMEIWLASADGDNQRQLTNLGARSIGFPRWSPDGRSIAFHSRQSGKAQIYVVDADSGVTRQITRDDQGCIAPSWSSDGKTLYITRSFEVQSHIDKVPASGGTPEPLFNGFAEGAEEVPGRNLILYTKGRQLGVFSRSFHQDRAGDVEERLVDDYLPLGPGIYTVEDGFYYVGSRLEKPSAFRLYSFVTKKSIDIAPAPPTLNLGLSVSPDRRRLVYCADTEANADLVLFELK